MRVEQSEVVCILLLGGSIPALAKTILVLSWLLSTTHEPFYSIMYLFGIHAVLIAGTEYHTCSCVIQSYVVSMGSPRANRAFPVGSACGVCIRLRVLRPVRANSQVAGPTRSVSPPLALYIRESTLRAKAHCPKSRATRPSQAVSTSSSIMSTILAMSFSRSLSSPLMFRLSSAFCAILMSSGFVGIFP